MGLEQVIYVLSNTCTECSVLTDSLPQLKEELSGILMHEKQIYFVNHYEGFLSPHAVCRNSIYD